MMMPMMETAAGQTPDPAGRPDHHPEVPIKLQTLRIRVTYVCADVPTSQQTFNNKNQLNCCFVGRPTISLFYTTANYKRIT